MKNKVGLPHYSKICDLFRKYGVSSAGLFGSRVFGDNRLDSDYDILVDFKLDSKVSFWGMIELTQKLEDILKKKVDLVTYNGLSPYIKQEVLKSVVTFYGKKN